MFEDNKLNWSKIFSSHKTNIIMALPILLLLIYFQPTDEVMKCNQYYRCKVEKHYLWIFPFNCKIQLSRNSKLIPKVYNDWFRKHGGYNGYTNYTDKSGKEVAPFTHYVCSARYSSDVDRCLDRQANIFQNYIENPKIRYKTQSNASGIRLAVFILALFIWIISIKFKRSR